MELTIRDAGIVWEVTATLTLQEKGSDRVKELDYSHAINKDHVPNEEAATNAAHGAASLLVNGLFAKWRIELRDDVRDQLVDVLQTLRTGGGGGASGAVSAVGGGVVPGAIVPPTGGASGGVGPCPHGVPSDGYCSPCTSG